MNTLEVIKVSKQFWEGFIKQATPLVKKLTVGSRIMHKSSPNKEYLKSIGAIKSSPKPAPSPVTPVNKPSPANAKDPHFRYTWNQALGNVD